MSELIIDDDPDPLSGSVNGYRINLETGLAYDGYELSQYYRELEVKEQEKRAVGHLSMVADRILREHDGQGEPEDKWVYNSTGDVFLRRRRFERSIDNGGTFNFAMYFLIDRSDGQDYCRSWWSESGRVNWCSQEKRVEPAMDVEQRLVALFSKPIDRKMGASALDSVRRVFRREAVR